MTGSCQALKILFTALKKMLSKAIWGICFPQGGRGLSALSDAGLWERVSHIDQSYTPSHTHTLFMLCHTFLTDCQTPLTHGEILLDTDMLKTSWVLQSREGV